MNRMVCIMTQNTCYRQLEFKNIKMKYFAAALLLICWMAMTFILTITIIGIVVIIDEYSAWKDFPKKLLAVFS